MFFSICIVEWVDKTQKKKSRTIVEAHVPHTPYTLLTALLPDHTCRIRNVAYLSHSPLAKGVPLLVCVCNQPQWVAARPGDKCPHSWTHGYMGIHVESHTSFDTFNYCVHDRNDVAGL